MGERRLSDAELADLELIHEHIQRDIAEYTAPRGTPTWDDRRVGNMLAQQPYLARSLGRALAEIREYRAAFRKLHAQVDLTDPACPVGVALTRAGAARGGYGPDDMGLDRLQLSQLETRDVASPRVSRLSPDEIDVLAWAVARAAPRGAGGHGLDDFDRHNRALAVIDKLLGLRGGR